jgi:hypothetical protein
MQLCGKKKVLYLVLGDVAPYALVIGIDVSEKTAAVVFVVNLKMAEESSFEAFISSCQTTGRSVPGIQNLLCIFNSITELHGKVNRQ